MLNTNSPFGLIIHKMDALRMMLWMQRFGLMNYMLWMLGSVRMHMQQLMVYQTLFQPQHNKLCWGWEENIMLEVVCTCLPTDVMVQANNLIHKWGNDKGWDGHHLYDLMSKTTTIRTEFRCITFEEFAIREGYPTFSVARDGIYNNKTTRVWSKLENDMEAD